MSRTSVPGFICDNKDTEVIMRRIHDTVTDVGAMIAEGVSFHAAQGEFHVETDGDLPPGAPAVVIPPSCLIPVNEFELAIDGDEIAIKSASAGATAFHQSLLADMLALYNRAGKIPRHRAVSFWPMVSMNEALRLQFMSGRSLDPAVRDLFDRSASGEGGDLLLDTFLKARTLKFMETPGEGEGRPVLMPVIDYFNHHIRAQPFQRTPVSGGRVAGMAVHNARPERGARECFVRYGMLDCFDCLLLYGYADHSAQFMRSVPLTLELAGVGTVNVHSFSVKVTDQDLPPTAADLRPFMPWILGRTENSLTVSHLIIPPPGAPLALKRVLAHLAGLLAPGMDEKESGLLGVQLEEVVLSANRQYYQDFHNIIENCEYETGEALAPLKEMVVRQRVLLDGYGLAF